MKMTASLMMPLLMLGLVSEVLQFTFAENRLRSFTALLKNNASIGDASQTCEEINQSLFTVYDEKDLHVINNAFQLNNVSKSIWLGMNKTSTKITWSNGTPIKESEFSIDETQQNCVAIKERELQHFNCSERKDFLCETSKGLYYLIRNKRNWCQALQYCRAQLMELSSNNKTELDKDKYENETFWVGLMLDKWEWLDQSCSTFRDVSTEGSDGTEKCSSLTLKKDPAMKFFGCDQDGGSFCSNGLVRIQVVEDRNLTWEQALDYCEAEHSRLLWIQDAEDQKTVNHWLRHSGTEGHRFWIGLRQSSVLGFWIWHNTMVTWNNWRDEKTPELLMSKHCGVISGDDFEWSAEDCRLTLPFICEEDIVKLKNDKG